MNLRKIEEKMIAILLVLIVLIIISLIVKTVTSNKGNNEIENDNVVINNLIAGSNFGKTNIEIMNFSYAYDYFDNLEDAINLEEYIKEALASYDTKSDEFDTKECKFENNKLLITLKSTTNSEEYLITVSEKETLLERIK